MERFIAEGFNYPNNDTLSSAATGQRVAAGAETTTFAVPVRYITVTYVTHDSWIAKTKAEAEATAGGAKDDRIFVKAGTTGIVFPWTGQDVFFVNAVPSETPTLYVVGHA